MDKNTPPVARVNNSPFNRTARHDAKYAAILSQAANLFNSKGSRATTLRDIAESLGLTKTSLYYYVKTKEQLIFLCYMAALEHHNKVLDEIELEHQSPLARISAFYLRHFDDWLAAHEGRGSFTAALLEIASLTGEHKKDVETHYTALFKRVRQYLRDGIADGSLRNCDTTSATRAILSSRPSWSLSWLHQVPVAQVPEIAQQALDILVHGLSAGSGDYSSARISMEADSPVPAKPFISREDENRMKQEAFYKAANGFFNKKGFKGTSLKEISGHLEVSKGAFYYHIKNKDDLLFSCYTYSMDIIEALQDKELTADGDGLQKLEQVCRRIFYAQSSEHGPLIRHNTITALPRERRGLVIQRTIDTSERFGDFIRMGIEDGSVRSVNPVVAEYMIAGAVNASMELQLWRKIDDIDAAAIDYFDVFFNGLLPRTPT